MLVTSLPGTFGSTYTISFYRGQEHSLYQGGERCYHAQLVGAIYLKTKLSSVDYTVGNPPGMEGKGKEKIYGTNQETLDKAQAFDDITLLWTGNRLIEGCHTVTFDGTGVVWPTTEGTEITQGMGTSKSTGGGGGGGGELMINAHL